MATIRINRGKWQAIVRRTGFPQQSKSFESKTNARKWARQKEAELDAGVIHTDTRILDKTTVSNILLRYRETVTINKKGHASESKRIDSFLKQPWANYKLSRVTSGNTDLVTTGTSSKIMQMKINTILSGLQNSSGQINSFQSMALRDGRAIREAINSGEKSFDEFLELLVSASKFKSWLIGAAPEETLLREYYAAIKAGTWAETLPAKGTRFSFFAGAGILVDMAFPTGLGTAAGLALGAGDAFLLDKLIKGWKPNHFVDGPLQGFIESSD